MWRCYWSKPIRNDSTTTPPKNHDSTEGYPFLKLFLSVLPFNYRGFVKKLEQNETADSKFEPQKKKARLLSSTVKPCSSAPISEQVQDTHLQKPLGPDTIPIFNTSSRDQFDKLLQCEVVSIAHVVELVNHQ
jgi:hypothetical protein